MANSDTPFGLKPVKHLIGASWNGKVNTYYVPSTDGTALYKGDAVKSAGSADSTGKFPSVTQAAAGDLIRGVVVGFGDNPYVMSHPDTPNRDYRPVSTAMYVFVVDDPWVIFEIQEDSTGNNLAITEVGLSTNVVVGSGSTVTGKSGMELDSSDTATDGNGQCKILRVVDREDNALGTNCKWEVLIVEHELLVATDV
jgi:hypothetical protein